MLEKVGHSVQVFTDGAVALDYMMTQPFDVLVTALEICNVNGFDLCAYARTRNEQGFPTYAIAMSSIQDTLRIIEALDRGADDFTEKTPRIEELVARLRVAERFLKAQHNLIRLATIDQLSGLYNRRAFFEEAARSSIVAEPNRASCAFVMLDIDHFKRINDAFGHDAGDHAIKGLHRSCASITRKPGGSVARNSQFSWLTVMRGTPTPARSAFAASLPLLRLP